MANDYIEIPIEVDRKSNLKKALTATERLERSLTRLAKAADEGRVSSDRMDKVLLSASREMRAFDMSSQKATATVRKFFNAQREQARATKEAAEAAKKEAADQKWLNSVKQESLRMEKQLSAEKDRLISKLNPLRAASNLYERELRDINRATEIGVLNDRQRQQALDALQNEFREFKTSTDGAVAATNRFAQASAMSNRGLSHASVITQQAGYQIGDFIVQVQSGTNAFVAFGQQATQVAGTLTLLGGKMVAIGTALGIVIPLTTALAAAYMRTRDAQKEAADGADDLMSAYGELESATNDLEKAVDQYNRALELSKVVGGQLLEAVLPAIQAEIGARKELLAVEAERFKLKKVELEEEINQRQRVIDSLFVELEASRQIALLGARTEQERLQINRTYLEATEDIVAANRELFLSQREQRATVALIEALLQDVKSSLEEADDHAEDLEKRTFENISNGASYASSLAISMRAAAAAAAVISRFLPGGPGVTTGTPLELGPYGGVSHLLPPAPAGGIPGVGGGSSGGGAGSKAEAEFKSFMEVLEDVIVTAEEFEEQMARGVVSSIESVSDAFGDFVMRGFRDFQGFVDSILNSFRSMLSQMISMAARNQIMISMGLAPSGTPGFFQTLGGGFSGLGGSIGGPIGSALQGLGGVTSQGLFGGIGASFKALGSLFTGGASALGGFASALGAAIPAIAIATVAISAFIGKTKELDNGLKLTVSNMDVLVETFRKTETSRFFGLFKSRNTEINPAPAEVADPITNAVNDIQKSVMEAAKLFDFGAETFNDFAYAVDISLKDLSDDERAAKIQEEIGKIGDAFASMVPQVSSLAELLEAANQKYDLTTRLLTAQGKEGELLARARERELEAVHPLNRALLEFIHKLEDANQAVNEAQSVWDAARSTYEGALSDLKAAMERQLQDAQADVDAAERALELAIQGRIQSITNMFNGIISTLEGALEVAVAKADQSRRIFEILDNALRSRFPVDDAGMFRRRGAALSYVQGGNFEERRLEDAVNLLNEPSERFFGTFVDYARDFADTTNAIREARDVAEETLTADEQAVQLLQAQIEQERENLQNQIEQLNALNDTEDAVLSVEEALRQLQDATSTYEQVQANHEELVAQFPELKDAVLGISGAISLLAKAQHEMNLAVLALSKAGHERNLVNASQGTALASFDPNAYLSSNPDVAAAISQGQTFGLSGNNISRAALAYQHYELHGQFEGRAFANGGMHYGGVRMVGERGPELEVTGPARIYSNRDTAKMFRDPELAQEVKGLRSEVAGLRDEQRQIQTNVLKFTKRTYDLERKWDVEGLPDTRAS